MTAAADFYTVIGNPIAHSRSPWLHQQFAEQTHQSLRYERSLLPTDGFNSGLAQLRSRGLLGCNVTMPFKADAFALAQWHSPAALLAQACNTLWWDAGALKAHNTDGVGLVRDITTNANYQLAGKRLLIVGAGGASAGILGPLIEAGCGGIHIANRSQSKALTLVQRHQALTNTHACALSAGSLDALNAQSDMPAFDVVINASAASLGGQRIVLPPCCMGAHTLAIDLAYGPASRVFLDWAASRGAATRDGLGMLVEQAAASFAIWRGVQPDTAHVLQRLRVIVDTPSV
ncbi:shikimate dehydrogenase [Comamonadaceae bacterium M7527]|nr:shikimate dehydrogenase [Comamonadaceae bacterium M7527]